MTHDESEDLGQHNQDLEEAGHGDQVDPVKSTLQLEPSLGLQGLYLLLGRCWDLV
jgi:hypothetical protein